jgi:hypothetical protein
MHSRIVWQFDPLFMERDHRSMWRLLSRSLSRAEQLSVCFVHVCHLFRRFSVLNRSSKSQWSVCAVRSNSIDQVAVEHTHSRQEARAGRRRVRLRASKWQLCRRRHGIIVICAAACRHDWRFQHNADHRRRCGWRASLHSLHARDRVVGSATKTRSGEQFKHRHTCDNDGQQRPDVGAL